MFIIVENQSVILGPMIWRQTMFKNCLMDDLEIDFDVPSNNPDRLPITVSENVKILPVTDIGTSNQYDPEIHWLNGPYYNFYDTYAEVYYTAYDKQIDFYKNELKQRVAANRWRYENMGVTSEIQGQTVSLITTREDRNLYLQAYQLGSNGVNWKFGSIFLILSNQELGQIVATVVSHVQAVFDWEAGKVAEIDSKDNLLDLKAINTKSDNPIWEPVSNNPMVL